MPRAPACRLSTGWLRLLGTGGRQGPARQRARELISRVEPELAEDARQVPFNRAGGDEQRLCDLAVGEALAGELGDAALAGGQRVEPGQDDSARPRPRRAKLGLGVSGERPGA